MTTLFSTLVQKRVPLLPAQVGDWIDIDPQTRLQVIYPLETNQTMIEIVKEQNARSVVFLLEMQGTRWLFTGDMEKESEAVVLDYLLDHPDLIASDNKSLRSSTFLPVSFFLLSSSEHKIDVLKVAHHGSKTSTTPDWLAYWNPAVAVISVGAMNTYGHPSPEIIDHLVKANVGIFRTDLMGEVQMEVRKEGIFTRMKLRN